MHKNLLVLFSALLFTFNLQLKAQNIAPQNPKELNYLNWLSKDYLQEHRIWKVRLTQGIKNPDQAIRTYGNQYEAEYTLFGEVSSLLEWSSYSSDTLRTLIHYTALRKDYKLEYLNGYYNYSKYSYRTETNNTPYKQEIYRITNTDLKIHEIQPSQNSNPYRELYFDLQKKPDQETFVCFNNQSIQLSKHIKKFNTNNKITYNKYEETVTQKGYEYQYLYEDNRLIQIKSLKRGETDKWTLQYKENGMLKSIDRYRYGIKSSTLEFFYSSKGVLKSLLDIDLKDRTMIITDIESYTY